MELATSSHSAGQRLPTNTACLFPSVDPPQRRSRVSTRVRLWAWSHLLVFSLAKKNVTIAVRYGISGVPTHSVVLMAKNSTVASHQPPPC